MKLFFQHLDDPHHKVAQAALSTLADIVLACRKPFEGYMERILPHVFSRLIDPKEAVRQPCSITLEIVSKTYNEQRSPKAKLAVIEFAINSFNKPTMNAEGAANIGILKLWLAKLTPLVHDKNTKLKESAITCIISVYTHFDSTASKKERQHSKSSYDPSDVVGTSSEDGYVGFSRKTQYLGRYSVGSLDSDGGRKWSSQDSTLLKSSLGLAASVESEDHSHNHNLETDSNFDSLSSKPKPYEKQKLLMFSPNSLQ
ncbi:hypothetical protein KIW84_058413 [Lathyrus oleraceus]|uniref:TOG domain-containing protein n=1 Tax=Pisum sativum TaxID=3888 RepID=A0A9D4X3V8_PEA|nr:hypothetical protein KIW84_058413 [Pisum sativum]